MKSNRSCLPGDLSFNQSFIVGPNVSDTFPSTIIVTNSEFWDRAITKRSFCEGLPLLGGKYTLCSGKPNSISKLVIMGILLSERAFDISAGNPSDSCHLYA